MLSADTTWSVLQAITPHITSDIAADLIQQAVDNGSASEFRVINHKLVRVTVVHRVDRKFTIELD